MTPHARRPQRAARAPRPRQQPVHIKDLIPDPENRRAHNPRNIGMIVDGLQQVGAARSIVLDDDDVILAGNGVIEAAAEAGITKVRVIEADGNEIIAVRRRGLTAEQKRKLAMYDNRTGELAAWNWEQLGKDKANDLDLAPWFSTAELDAGVGKVVKFGRTDPDQIPDARTTGIIPGDVFELGPHRIVCGDTTNEEVTDLLMGEHKAEAMITDPPYCSGGYQEAGKKAGSIGTRGQDRIANDALSTRGYMTLIRTATARINAGLIYVFTDWRMWVNLFDVVESSGYGVRAMVVWDKGTPGMGRGWRSQHELIMCGSRVSMPFDSKQAQGNVIQCARTGNEHHPTEKPVELMVKILQVSDIAKIVCDPFMGSGTTLIACEQTDRIFRGLDLDPVHVQKTIDRWEAFTGQKAIKVGEVCAAGSRRHQS